MLVEERGRRRGNSIPRHVSSACSQKKEENWVGSKKRRGKGLVHATKTRRKTGPVQAKEKRRAEGKRRQNRSCGMHVPLNELKLDWALGRNRSKPGPARTRVKTTRKKRERGKAGLG